MDINNIDRAIQLRNKLKDIHEELIKWDSGLITHLNIFTHNSPFPCSVLDKDIISKIRELVTKPLRKSADSIHKEIESL